MGTTGSNSTFLEPVRYSIYEDSIDTDGAVQENLAKLNSRRMLAMITSVLATAAVLIAIVTPCWVTSVKLGSSIGLFHACHHGDCVLVHGQSYYQGIGALVAVLITVSQIISLVLFRRALTNTVILFWNICAFLFLSTAMVSTLAMVHVTLQIAPVVSGKVFYGLSFFLAWIGTILCFVSGGVHFHLSHKFVWVIHGRTSAVQDFKMDSSKE
eukprot:scpid95945/ scgid8735/ 